MNAANIITILRLFAVIPFTIFLAGSNYLLAFIFFLFAGLSDLLDGFIARRFNQKTKLGGFLDPIADKLLVFAGNLLLVIQSALPLWFFAAIIAKDLSILLGVYLLKSKAIDWEPNPNRPGKIASFLQGVIILIAIVDKGFYDTGWFIPMTIGVCLTFMLWSWYLYFGFYRQLTRGAGNNAN